MMGTGTKLRILVCPLDWGLGHAARCVPLINRYLNAGHEVIVASYGQSGELLKQEFPTLLHIEFPSFTIRYSASGNQIPAILRTLPDILRYYRKEHRMIKAIVKVYEIDLVVSDNRFGLWGCGTHTMYITHQLMVKMPHGLKFLEYPVHLLHKHIINKYDRCAIPDSPDIRLSGDLANKYPLPRNAEFVGIHSRFQKEGEAVPCDILIIISGPEPQRSMFETEMVRRYKYSKADIVMVRGLPQNEYTSGQYGNIKVFNHMNGKDLAAYIRGTRRIICRSGYTTLMDLHVMGKLSCATLYPTPGQTEQEYLAAYCSEKKLSKTSTVDKPRKRGRLSRK